MISDLVKTGLILLDKIIPDPVAKQNAKLKLLELQQAGELAELEAETKLALAQIGVNQTEAASADPFVRRWRPAVGWVCVTALGYQFLARPLLAWLSPLAALPIPVSLDTGDLMTLLGGLLGLSGLRTLEKVRGVSS